MFTLGFVAQIKLDDTYKGERTNNQQIYLVRISSHTGLFPRRNFPELDATVNGN
jgi:hypothetical protein